nr:PREDICTED: LOW QUALITY PROTEIN: 1-phosphatidylinositol phosphodiesterase-like [Latimeria chalumnae]|eukprot:XP_014345142.1 PREDICTED: LOW QUALITY PROTEIN: 1-phosphatidylinositol phosphodiesterase-like [Latimeria chalumnae]
MSSVPDKTSLAALSVPGAHNAMSFYGGSLAQCQSWALYKQYEAGVRFVNVRCRHFQNNLPIHHGVVFQKAYFSEVLHETVRFLQAYPSETVMRVKEGYKPAQNTQRFDITVAQDLREVGASWFWQWPNLPTLGEVRGKIVVLQNFDGPTMGIPYSSLDISDEYQVPTMQHVEKKWLSVESHLNTARRGDLGKMYLTFCSGAVSLRTQIASPKKINLLLYDYLKSNSTSSRNQLGIVTMDFPGAELVHKIIHSN